MKADRFTLATDRRERPIDFTQFLWSSDPATWAGFGLELHRVGPSGALKDFGVPDILLGLCVGGSAEMVWELGTKRRERIGPGQFILLDRGERQPSITWSGTRETLYVRLRHEQLRQLLPQADDSPASVEPQFAAVDVSVQRLVRCLYDEARAGAPSGAAYAQALSLALAQRLLARYARRAGGFQRRRDAFTPARMVRIRDYVQANLGRDTSLLELAKVAGLSPHYFLHLFKQAFGVTPHRYLLAQRVEAAKRLLSDGALSLSEIALSLGFADQSHFTATFRRIAGTTPMRFRRDG
jgi:AraC family transcriptional regulator